MTETYNILSLDGGGIRGLITAIILERIYDRFPGYWDKIDLIAGTSTGGILALGLALGLDPVELQELYTKHADDVFYKSTINIVFDVGQLFGAKYSVVNLQELLYQNYGFIRLKDLKKKVLISTVDLGGTYAWKPKFYHNFEGCDSDGEEYVYDVALKTSAAPTFFPVRRNHVDGGVIANNPSMCALAQALNPDFGNAKIKNIRLLSLGTGHITHKLNIGNANWGLAQWIPEIFYLVSEGMTGLVDYQCNQLMKENFHRVNPYLFKSIGLDGIEYIKEMDVFARAIDLTDTFIWIDKNYEL